ncbi:hypothetical protein R1sor_023275 [Riccia sorocarpa]|uniref:Uncharacterized protein n=1 Tax=Riccia sorocarpa TaxID=122646 RepID=A0ABD3GRD9_9MARC
MYGLHGLNASDGMQPFFSSTVPLYPHSCPLPSAIHLAPFPVNPDYYQESLGVVRPTIVNSAQTNDEVPAQNQRFEPQYSQSQAEVAHQEPASARPNPRGNSNWAGKRPATTGKRKSKQNASASCGQSFQQPTGVATEEARSPGTDNEDDESSGEDSNGHGSRWFDWQVKLLIEAKRDEYFSVEGASSHYVILNAPYKWRKITEKLVTHNISFLWQEVSEQMKQDSSLGRSESTDGSGSARPEERTTQTARRPNTK